MGLTGLRLGTVFRWTTTMRFNTVVDKFAFLSGTGQPLTVYVRAENQKPPDLHVEDMVRSMLFAADELGDGEAYNVVDQNGRLPDVVDPIVEHLPDVDTGHTKAEQLN